MRLPTADARVYDCWTMDGQEDLYKIGVVAKRTGIAHERLRAWERRYGLAPAARAGHTRFYSGTQVARLVAIKTLLDQGHAISEVIHWTDDELQRRLRLQPSLQPAPECAPKPASAQVWLIGAPLLLAYRERDDSEVDVVAEWTTAAELARQQDPLPKPDCIAIHMPTLDDQPIELIEDVYDDVPIVVVYQYATKADREQFEQADYSLLKGPASWRSVENLILATSPPSPTGDAQRFYSDDELLHICSVADQAPSGCVRELADLVVEINTYAAHAEHCESDEDYAATIDDVHNARGHLEQALRRLVEKHGLIVAN